MNDFIVRQSSRYIRQEDVSILHPVLSANEPRKPYTHHLQPRPFTQPLERRHVEKTAHCTLLFQNAIWYLLVDCGDVGFSLVFEPRQITVIPAEKVRWTQKRKVIGT